ncbi:hypothetical protein CPC08DRAFT_515448 [Agrocybe pediades]|nr:hypothetical protein CPC08DRAFT_515448 [Agrocybe pediades]
MCRWRQVVFFYGQCGHCIPLPDEHILCESMRCRFSTNHPSTCLPPQCRQTCAQQHGYPQRHIVTKHGKCPVCADKTEESVTLAPKVSKSKKETSHSELSSESERIVKGKQFSEKGNG